MIAYNKDQEKIIDSPIIFKLLKKKGLIEKQDCIKFLFPEYEDLYNPFLLKDAMKAAIRINKAIEQKKKILIFGDKDADGLSGSAIMFKILSAFGADIQCKISEADDDYDINEKILFFAETIRAEIVITVDCGISATAIAEKFKPANIDFIITDHHEPPEILPDAYAIINPKQKNCNYPDKSLSGSAVAFKLATAIFLLKNDMMPADLSAYLPSGFFDNLNFCFFLDEYLPLAAIGVIADVMPLKNENRVITRLAHNSIKENTPAFIRILMGMKNLAEINGDFFGYVLGPVLNSCRRMKAGSIGFDWMIQTDESQLRKITRQLIELNSQRKVKADEMFKNVFADAAVQAESESCMAIVLDYKNFEHGVTGLVANKIKEHFKKPVFLFIIENEIAGGSGRCPDGMNLLEIVRHFEKSFIKFGGHKSSVGVSMLPSEIDKFRKEINNFLFENKQYLIQDSSISANEISFNEINFNLLDELELFEPYGKENECPVFKSVLPVKQAYTMGADNNHLNLYLNANMPIRAIAWNRGAEAAKINTCEFIDSQFYIQPNFYAGKKSIKLNMV